MKKRILSSFLSLVLVLSLMPVSALAAEGPQNVAPAVVTEEPGEVHGEPPVEEAAGPEEPACICESLCPGETVNTDCPICTADYTACTYEAPADEDVYKRQSKRGVKKKIKNRPLKCGLRRF